MKETALSLNNVLNRQTLPALNACADCEKLPNEHGKKKHEYNEMGA